VQCLANSCTLSRRMCRYVYQKRKALRLASHRLLPMNLKVSPAGTVTVAIAYLLARDLLPQGCFGHKKTEYPSPSTSYGEGCSVPRNPLRGHLGACHLLLPQEASSGAMGQHCQQACHRLMYCRVIDQSIRARRSTRVTLFHHSFSLSEEHAMYRQTDTCQYQLILGYYNLPTRTQQTKLRVVCNPRFNNSKNSHMDCLNRLYFVMVLLQAHRIDLCRPDTAPAGPTTSS
jgi:hypothetical protein